MTNPIIFESAKNYLALIHNSLGSQLFKNRYAQVAGESQDLVEDGNLSCAFYVSSLCLLQGLISSLHLTVDGTVSDLLNSGWHKLDQAQAQEGDILGWGPSATGHKHIGFYLGGDQAISNSSSAKVISQHHWLFEGADEQTRRQLELVLRYDFK
jgi:hypothetical protein